jgi:hypothetical protein
MAVNRNAFRLLAGKLEGKRSLGRPRRTCVDKIEMDFVQSEWSGVYWIEPAQDREWCRALVNTVMDLSGSIICCEVF